MIDFIWNYTPWIWVAVTVICIVIESLTLALTTIWFACSACVMVFLSFTPLPFRWQLLIFIVLALALLIFTRPLVLRKFHRHVATNSDSLIGKSVKLLSAVTESSKGTAKVNGVVWSVQAAAGTPLPLADGTECTITALEGNTLIVSTKAAAQA